MKRCWIFFLFTILTGSVHLTADIAMATTSEWMTPREMKRFAIKIKRKNGLPTRLDCKAGKGGSVDKFARMCITYKISNPSKISWSYQIRQYGLLATSKRNMERAERRGFNRRSGFKLKYASFVRIAALVSDQAYACELIHIIPTK